MILGSFRTSLARTYVDVASPAKPTLEIARALPFSTRELDNNMLVILGSLGDLKASREMVKRHIMGVDGVDYDTASATFEEVDQKNKGTYSVIHNGGRRYKTHRSFYSLQNLTMCMRFPTRLRLELQ